MLFLVLPFRTHECLGDTRRNRKALSLLAILWATMLRLLAYKTLELGPVLFRPPFVAYIRSLPFDIPSSVMALEINIIAAV